MRLYKTNLMLVIIMAFSLFACNKMDSFIEKAQNQQNRLKSYNITSFEIKKENNPSINEDIKFCLLPKYNIAYAILSNENKNIDLKTLVPTFSLRDCVAELNGKELVNSGSTIDLSNKIDITLYFNDNREHHKNFTIALYRQSDIPVTMIQTDTIIYNKENWVIGNIKINGLDKYDEIYDTINIKGRGNSTWLFPKKAYNIKLTNKQSLLGMPKSKRWCLMANYRDKTLLRNDLAYYIGQNLKGLSWTPHCEYTDLYLNGEFKGNYQITEQIRIDKNRINVNEMKSSDDSDDKYTGGYILEFDKYYDSSWKFKTLWCNLPINLKEPDNEINFIQFQYIKNYVNSVEELLVGKEYEKAYTLIDIDSFVDYWMVQELSGNGELQKGPYSAYMYKDKNSKLCAGPLWDFDYSTFMSSNVTQKRCTESLWYKYLFKDSHFRQNVKAHFQKYESFLESIPDYIESRREYLRQSSKMNWNKWSDMQYNLYGYYNGDEKLSSDQAINLLKENYTKRLLWLKTYIYSL